MYKNRIFARKCRIKEVSNQQYQKFIELNHIQGYAAAKYKIGLYYEDELVQVCGFRKNKFKNDEIELIRSCSKLNTQVVGGFTKLIQYFIRIYNPKILISYVDLRYFDGKGYKDWELIEQTKPNYWYWKMNTKLDLKSEKYELINILENACDYIKIWDSGNLKYGYKGKFNE